jgi:hypothetical protein
VSDEHDPTAVRRLVVRPDDLVAARQANVQGGGRAVLRVTPPFSGRMRARLHRSVGEDDPTPGPAPLTVRPAALLADDAPEYPHPDETEDALRADPGEEYTRQRHRERHERAVESWRASLAEYVVDRVTLSTAAGPHEVAVSLLGG